MFQPGRTNSRELSKSLRKLVHQNLGKEIERAPWQRTNRNADKREISILCEDVREGLDKFKDEDEHCREERSAMLDSRKSEVLATNILARLQAQTTASFEEPVLDEQRDWVCDRIEAHFGARY